MKVDVYEVEGPVRVRRGLWRYWFTCGGKRLCMCLHKGSRSEVERQAAAAVKRINRTYGPKSTGWRDTHRLKPLPQEERK